MDNEISCDLCVIGAGSGGLSVAAGAAQMGARVVLIEKGDMGGDCLNTGCVPSKALLAAAHAAQAARRAGRFGVKTGKISVDAQKVSAHVQGVIETIAPHDSQERFEALGVTVIRASAQFVAPDQVEAGGRLVRAKYFVVATGSSPFVPPIDGLAALAPLTNESVFNLEVIPDHLIVIGGGPIGCEMAQAFRGLGADVTVLEMGRILPQDDADAVEVVRTRLLEDGVVLHEGVKVVRAEGTPDAPHVIVADADGREHVIKGSHILVAAGRRANVLGLGLERAGVDFSPQGVEVDLRLRAISNRRIFAIGDVAAILGKAGPQFTHVAAYHAGVVLKNALFKWPAKANHALVPHVTYTDPELAHVGLSENRARDAYSDAVRVLKAEFSDNDRARAEGSDEGLIKVVVGRRGKILGCTIVGCHAGELIGPWVLAMEQGLKISAMASTIAPYPSLGEISKRAAGAYYTPSLYSSRTRAIVKFLMKVL
jgi:pyruvate/2-oxoglutarate dehydrogenase complex dihydrolipoamide dehydrogenase (E3) component